MRAVPATFTAMLRAGTEPDLYYTYFTDLPQVLLAGQAADITQYVNTTPCRCSTTSCRAR